MEKTTVYLPRVLKGRLARVAEDTGVSEAQLIREGIEHVVASRTPPRPQLGTFSSGDPRFADPDRIDEELRKGFGRL